MSARKAARPKPAAPGPLDGLHELASCLALDEARGAWDRVRADAGRIRRAARRRSLVREAAHIAEVVASSPLYARREAIRLRRSVLDLLAGIMVATPDRKPVKHSTLKRRI